MKITIKKGYNEKKQKDMFIIDLSERVTKEQMEMLKLNKVYYSPFLKSFISYNEITSEDITEILNTTNTEKKTNTKKIEYYKNLFDYISVEEYQDFILNYYSDFEKLPNWYKFRHQTIQEDIEAYQREQISWFNEAINKWGKEYFKLTYIRHAIVSKSLGLEKEEFSRFNANGDGLRYIAIWDKLPIIEDLKIDKSQAYTASWGYDQTNVDIAYLLNKKVFGLDVAIVTTNHNNIMFVRVKHNEKYFNFGDGVRNFSKDSNPFKTFEQDASQTGQYR